MEIEKRYHASDYDYVVKYVPRWKWFKPPKWKIFRWAYNVNVVFINHRA